MLHKAWNSKEEMPYCFPRSSIKFQGHTGQNITDFDPNWAFPDYRPVAAFKSLRFALFFIVNGTLRNNLQGIFNQITIFFIQENDLKILFAKWQPFGPSFNVLRPNTYTLLRQRYSMQCIILSHLKFKIQLHIPPSRIMWVFPNNELEMWFSDIKITIFEQVYISSIWLGDELVLVIFVSEKWTGNSQWHKWHKTEVWKIWGTGHIPLAGSLHTSSNRRCKAGTV